MYDKILKSLVFIAIIAISNPPLTVAAEFYNPNSTLASLAHIEHANNISNTGSIDFRVSYGDLRMPFFTPRTDLETVPEKNPSTPSLKELAMLKVLSACPFENFEDCVPSLSKYIPTDLIEEARQFLSPSKQ
jgi:hypothetical protein